jgi:hypothetical protein
MELITILNRCHRFQGFVYRHARFSPDKKSIEVSVRPRKGSAAICSRCHQLAPGYDQLAERHFDFIPMWGFFVFLLYTMRRVDCPRCEAVVELQFLGVQIKHGADERTLSGRVEEQRGEANVKRSGPEWRIEGVRDLRLPGARHWTRFAVGHPYESAAGMNGQAGPSHAHQDFVKLALAFPSIEGSGVGLANRANNGSVGA